MNTIGYIQTNEINLEGYVYLQRGDRYFRGCTRCGGTGHYSYNGYDSICYKCNNDSSAKLGEHVGDLAGATADSVKRNKARLAREAKREKERLAKLAKREAAQLAIKASHPAVYEFLMAYDRDEDHNTFVASMATEFQFNIGISKIFSDKMISGIENVIAKREAKAVVDAARPEVPTNGRQTIIGTILSSKIVESDFGKAYKIVVEDDRGFKVYSSLPAKQVGEAIEAFEESNDPSEVGYGVWFLGSVNEPEMFKGVKGRRIQFDAAITASDDDKSFGFASRPTKGAWLA